MYRDRLARLGVEMRTWSEFNDHTINVPTGYEQRVEDAIRDGVAQVDWAPIDWADVILFRRWYSVAPCCEDCDTTGSDDFVATHCRAMGHRQNTPDRLLPLLLATIEAHPELLRGRGIVYETDDDLLAGTRWLPFYRRLIPDRPIIERMLRRADLVTVSTPVLARMAGHYNDATRVLRNAVDPAWYESSDAGLELPGDPRVLYYGPVARVRDYEVCREAVDQLTRSVPGVRRVWLGADADRVRELVDEAHGYVEGVPAFARALTGLRPDIGLAPVVGDDFDRAHSELHWLEYSLAGAATIASRTMGGGPYDVIRDGVDGILARNRAEWRDGLRRLATWNDLRQELGSRARERVLAEYNPDDRAEEWADAYRWAAEHAGRGSPLRLHAVGAPSDPQAFRAADQARDSSARGPSARADALRALPTAGPLHVLVYGSLDAGVTDSLRIGCFVEPLARLGVEVGPGSRSPTISWPDGDRPPGASRPSGDFLRDSGLTALAWADVVVFRRWRSTHPICTECEIGLRPGEPALAAHVRSSGHRTLVPDLLMRPIVDLLAAHPSCSGGGGWSTTPTTTSSTTRTGRAWARPARRERDLILRILAIADIVTTATTRCWPSVCGPTPEATSASSETPSIRPGTPGRRETGPGRGSARRLPRCSASGCATTRWPGRPWTRWPARCPVCAGSGSAPPTSRASVACVDEARPWVDGLAAFGAALVGRPARHRAGSAARRAVQPGQERAPLARVRHGRRADDRHGLRRARPVRRDPRRRGWAAGPIAGRLGRGNCAALPGSRELRSELAGTGRGAGSGGVQPLDARPRSGPTRTDGPPPTAGSGGDRARPRRPRTRDPAPPAGLGRPGRCAAHR